MTVEGSTEIGVVELAEKQGAEELQLVDVRTDEEWDEGRIEGSRHINLNELTAAAESIDRERPVVFICSGGNRSAMAAEAFRTAGYDAYSLAGGLSAWQESGRPLD